MKKWTNLTRLCSKTLFSPLMKITPKKKTVLKELVDIIQIIRYEWGQTSELIPFADGVKLRYRDWLFEKTKNKAGVRGTDGSPFTPEQLTWLEMIKNYIAKMPAFSQKPWK